MWTIRESCTFISILLLLSLVVVVNNISNINFEIIIRMGLIAIVAIVSALLAIAYKPTK